jgi:hypothetical protein
MLHRKKTPHSRRQSARIHGDRGTRSKYGSGAGVAPRSVLSRPARAFALDAARGSESGE